MTSFSFSKYFDAFELDVNVVKFVYYGKTRSRWYCWHFRLTSNGFKLEIGVYQTKMFMQSSTCHDALNYN